MVLGIQAEQCKCSYRFYLSDIVYELSVSKYHTRRFRKGHAAGGQLAADERGHARFCQQHVGECVKKKCREHLVHSFGQN